MTEETLKCPLCEGEIIYFTKKYFHCINKECFLYKYVLYVTQTNTNTSSLILLKKQLHSIKQKSYSEGYDKRNEELDNVFREKLNEAQDKIRELQLINDHLHKWVNEELNKKELEVRKSLSYKKVLKHRETCNHWNKDFEICIDCFGGGLKKFTKNLSQESLKELEK